MEQENNGRALSRRTWVIIVGALLVMLGVGGFRFANFVLNGAAGETAQPELAVHVKGAVEEPGLYYLPADSRVADAVEAAGGMLPEADTDRLNLAAFLTDGAQIVIHTVGEQEEGVINGDGAGSSAGVALININTASLAQLESLPGIGETKAQAILDYRESHGDFATVEQLTRVSGIGQHTMEAIRDYVYVE